MTKILAGLIAGSLLGASGVAAAAPPAKSVGAHAIGADVLYSSDSGHSETARFGLDLDLRWDGPDDRLGLRLERARYRPLGQAGKTMDRAFVRIADSSRAWQWAVLAGSDGHSIIGGASIHNQARIRQEYFVERDIVETPIGVSRRLYSTFAGGAVDLPADDRNVVTVLGGVQLFGGDNVRTHLRGTYVHVVKPDWGLSVQLRTRYFRNSSPHEQDYYSPRWYAEAIPVVQVRRFVGGWQLLAAGGYGAQRDADRPWHSARYLNLRVTSPKFRRDWAGNAALVYSNTPTGNSFAYSYLQVNFGVTKSF